MDNRITCYQSLDHARMVYYLEIICVYLSVSLYGLINYIL